MYVGIDIAKAKLDVHILPSNDAFTVTRDEQGITDLVARLQALPATLVVMEATGGYETIVAAALAAAGVPLIVVNPRQIRDFARATGRLAKTDTIDPQVMARFGETLKPEPRPVPDAEARALGELVTRRRQILEMIVAERNRREHLTQKRLLRGLDSVLALLKKQLEAVERDLDETVRRTPAWREREDLLTSVPGIGKTIARTLIAEMPELGTLDRRRIAALAGLAPINRDSGTLRGRRTIAGGRMPVRSALYMAVLVALRHKLPLHETYKKLREAGKPAKVAITACMRKLLTHLNAILRDKKSWQNA